MDKQKIIYRFFIKLLGHKSNSRVFFIFYVLFLIPFLQISKAQTDNLKISENKNFNIQYLDSKNELEDYILDTGDSIFIEFVYARELSDIFLVNEEGELFLPRIETTFVRGLTPSELENLLEKKFSEFLIQPKIKIRIVRFKSPRVLVQGEVRSPGLYKFPAYTSGSFININNNNNSNSDSSAEQEKTLKENQDTQKNLLIQPEFIVKRSNEKLTTISNVLRKAGGITSKSDLSKIRIIRDIPISKGGGKKSTLINFYSYLNESNPKNDVRIFDGDIVFIPKLIKENRSQLPKSILSGVSPKFISVSLFGRVENPGVINVPLEGSLSDAIDLTGPIKPLSGKVVLIRYNPDGTILKKNISYSAAAKRGSRRNPFLKDNDLITVKSSLLGKTTGVIKEVTAPFLGIYSAKEVIESFNE